MRAQPTYTGDAVPRGKALVLLRAFTLLGLAASAALAVDYRSIDTAFCGANSGCAALRRTGIAYLWGLGLTLPELGLLGLAAVFALSLSNWRRWAACLAVAGGVAGLAFLVSQAVVLRQFCWLCVTTDLASIAAGVCGIVLLRRPAELDAPSPLAAWVWPALAALITLAPAAWPKLRPTAPVPEVIRGYYRPGKVNVVEFADFECPFCRNLHQRLKALLAPHGERVHFVRLNMPLDGHPHARGAALAVLCAEATNKAEPMADFLFATEDLSSDAIRKGAAGLGLDLGAFDSCLRAPETEARLAREIAVVKEAGLEGLPTTYVGGRRIVGAQSDDTFSAAIEHAKLGEDERGIPGWLYLTITLALLAAVLRFGYASGDDDKRVGSSEPT